MCHCDEEVGGGKGSVSYFESYTTTEKVGGGREKKRTFALRVLESLLLGKRRNIKKSYERTIAAPFRMTFKASEKD